MRRLKVPDEHVPVLVARHQHLERGLGRHVAGERHRRRGAEQADIDARDGEARVLAGDGEIAGADKLAARSGRDAMDAGDDGDGEEKRAAGPTSAAAGAQADVTSG